MRQFIQACYRIMLKGAGAIGLFVCCTYAMTLTNGIVTADPMFPIPEVALATLALISLLVAGFLDRLPSALSKPSRPWHIAIILPITAALAIISVFTIIILVSELGLGDEIQRPIAVNISTGMILLYVLSAITGTVLSLSDPARAELV